MRFFLIAVSTVAALVYIAVGVVERQHIGVAIAFDISAETSTQTRLEDELRQLRIDRAALLDPTRLTPLAERNGLRVPAPDQVIVVPVLEVADGS